MTSTADATALFQRVSATGTRDFVLVFDVVLYLEEGVDQWPGIVDFYRKSLAHIEKDIRYYVVDGRSKYRRVRADTFELLPFWAGPDAAERSIYGLTLHGGPTPEDAAEVMFDFYSDGADPPYLRLAMPAEFASRPTLVDDVLDLVRNVKLRCGTAGFALSKEYDYDTSSERGPIFALSRRFQGVDFGSPLYFAKYVKGGLKTVNWMTFLGEELAARSGGIDKLSKTRASGIHAHKLKYGVALQAGERPILGDTNRQESTELYRAVNRLVAESRFPVESIGVFDEIGGEENTREWLARFDE